MRTFDKVANEKYLATVNHPEFREANKLVHEARKALFRMGMTKDEAHGWISAWSSGAGDGIV